jgi:hypothetical protein
MQNVPLHQQRLYSLIEAALALIALFLPWISASATGFGVTRSANGMTSWGLISLIGVIGVIVACLMGDKMKPFDEQGKKIALAGFGLIVLGAIAYFIRIQTLGGTQTAGYYTIKVKASAGMGLWMALVAGLVGLAWVSGFLDKLGKPQTVTATTTNTNTNTPIPPPNNTINPS